MKRSYPFLALLALLGLSVNPLSAAPEDAESASQSIFQQLDKNSDGTVTAEEVPEDKERFFDHLIRKGDQNKDGKLSKDEFEAGLKKEEQKFPAGEGLNRNRGPRNFDYKMFLSRLDRNGDKKISKEELPEPLRARMEPLFERLNKEEISLDEFEKFGIRFRGGRPPGNPSPKPGEMSEGAQRFFNMLDTNKDGKLTLDEAPDRGKRILKSILEKSGKGNNAELTKEEFQKGLAAFRPDQRRPGREGDKEMKRPEMRKDAENRPTRSSSRSPKRSELPEGAQRFFERLDTNKDGKLTLDEAPVRGKLFVRQLLDKSGKGADDELTMEEFKGEFTSFRPDQRRPGRENEKEMKGRTMRAPQIRDQAKNQPSEPSRRRPGSNFFQTVDLDNDGKLSKYELNQIDRVFDRLDRNRNGYLEIDEVVGQRRGRINPIRIEYGQQKLKLKTETEGKKASE
ncbi:EF-hand domain-containing protein [Gimesia fumaroli]|jgi:Ca2+-binding EF-hand superfamily protein|uniref:Transaldolase/EF-hand domain-containing protein n=1 Tax=Gimesia fumaroli TaxID=2527976 RepID=A0A518IDC5_9PLAN|nr:EF-hand domain-containing protein [Gimesia fumaroli]QDV51059.1 transaldolase/EF-hand domain-containing protein [Gimesia fumaroli]